MTPVTAEWHDFLIAVAGAAGALLGLLFVALSINLARILALPGVAGRAAQALLVIGAVLLGALAGLIPSQSRALFGVELLIVTGLGWGVPVVLTWRAVSRREHRGRSLVARILAQQTATIPGIVASVLVLFGVGEPLRWFAFDVLMSFGVGLVSAWVLLVEIVR